MTRTLDQALSAADLSAMAAYNLLVNGFQTVSQENGASAKSAGPASAGYTTDQFQLGAGGTMVATGQQVAAPFTSQPDIPFGLKLNITTAMATLTGSAACYFLQPIEGLNLARLQYGSANARPVTIAFMARSSIALTAYFALRPLNSSGATVRSFLQRFTLPANTDTFVTFTVPGDTAQALVTSNAASMQAMWCFGSGPTNQGVAGWQSGDYYAASDVTNLAATAGNNVVISGAVMFPGVVPISQSTLPLLARQYDDELRKCQRYYEQISLTLAQSNNYQIYSLKTRKRTNPTLSITSGSTGSAGIQPYDDGTLRQYASDGNYHDITVAANARM